MAKQNKKKRSNGPSLGLLQGWAFLSPSSLLIVEYSALALIQFQVTLKAHTQLKEEVPHPLRFSKGASFFYTSPIRGIDLFLIHYPFIASEAAKASNPNCRFKFRRAPACNSSTPAIARIAQATSTVLLNASNSLASG
jgi:hypothetical protein